MFQLHARMGTPPVSYSVGVVDFFTPKKCLHAKKKAQGTFIVTAVCSGLAKLERKVSQPHRGRTQ